MWKWEASDVRVMAILRIGRPTFLFPFCPRNSNKLTNLPLRRPKFLITVSSASPSSSSMENPPEGYRRNVGICLINPSKKIFAASRLDIPSAWQMPQLRNPGFGRWSVNVSDSKCISLVFSCLRPRTIEIEILKMDGVVYNYVEQGGIDEGEDPRSAAIRELREETGVSSAEFVAEAPHWLAYDFPPHVREKLNREWGTDWKGQAQKWFLLKFTGEDSQINLLGDGTEKAEFGEWAWMSSEQIIDLAVDFKKPVYKEVLTVFDPYLR